MWRWIKATFGLKGSWRWACRQMCRGRIVRRRSDTGDAKYKLDKEGQGRIVWAFTRTLPAEWESANIFIDDFVAADWETWTL